MSEKQTQVASQEPILDNGNVGEALAADVKLLARLHDRELDAETLNAFKAKPVTRWFNLRLSGSAFEEACRLISSALEGIGDVSDRVILDEHAAEYAAIYLTHAYRAAPTESVWRDEEGLERQAAMFATRDWYEHFGVKVPNWRARSDDHIVHELEFLSLLLESSNDKQGFVQPARFLRDHPLVWVPEFCGRVVQRCKLPLYAGFALLTAAYIEHLAEFLGALSELDMTPPSLQLPPVMGTKGANGPTCGDPPASRYVPGVEPSW